MAPSPACPPAQESGSDIVVNHLIRGGSAERSAKVQSGDVIVSIDDRDVRGKGVGEMRNFIVGPEGSTVNLGFVRDGQTFTVALLRGSPEYITSVMGPAPSATKSPMMNTAASPRIVVCAPMVPEREPQGSVAAHPSFLPRSPACRVHLISHPPLRNATPSSLRSGISLPPRAALGASPPPGRHPPFSPAAGRRTGGEPDHYPPAQPHCSAGKRALGLAPGVDRSWHAGRFFWGRQRHRGPHDFRSCSCSGGLCVPQRERMTARRLMSGMSAAVPVSFCFPFRVGWNGCGTNSQIRRGFCCRKPTPVARFSQRALCLLPILVPLHSLSLSPAFLPPHYPCPFAVLILPKRGSRARETDCGFLLLLRLASAASSFCCFLLLLRLPSALLASAASSFCCFLLLLRLPSAASSFGCFLLRLLFASAASSFCSVLLRRVRAFILGAS